MRVDWYKREEDLLGREEGEKSKSYFLFLDMMGII